ncbi:DUF1804 family protein [Colwellia psychrerythraea]|uniref:Uncharacterized protein n=1 Tax=Colwellia psychrerythraea TaxID=28229 RepID=A0A099KRA2_COLPS|nr:DUF1804 family protein [Colwellia psychrerythraea]KGJ92158.1 protein of unknown function DUF1804 [Colwellia psychrerythraea]
MARNQEKLEAVRRSYVYDRQSLKAAAEFNDVPVATASRWKIKAKDKGDCWDKARSASRLAQGGIGDLSIQVLEDFTMQYSTLMDILKYSDMEPLEKATVLTKLADSYVKITKAAGGSDANIGRLSVAMETLELFAQFLGERFPQNLEYFVIALEQFAPELSKQYG